MGILYGAEGNVYATLAKAFTGLTAYSFLVFNLLCAPCFAAIGAIKREMNSAKWTWFAIGYQCGFAYVVSLMINQFGNLFTGNIHGAVDIVSLVFAFAFLALIIFMLVRPYKEATKLYIPRCKGHKINQAICCERSLPKCLHGYQNNIATVIITSRTCRYRGADNDSAW